MPTEEEIQNMSHEEITKLQEENCIFCKIAKSEIPAKILYKDNICTAFLDINPASFGHMLLIPNKHYPLMPLIPDNEIQHMGVVSKHLSHACIKALKHKKVSGTNILIANGTLAGQKAQHVIIHIIPRVENDKLTSKLTLTKHTINNEQQNIIAKALIEKINVIFNVDMTKINENNSKTEIKQELENKIDDKSKNTIMNNTIPKDNDKINIPEKIESSNSKENKNNNTELKSETNSNGNKNSDNNDNNKIIKEKKADLDKISKLFGA